MISSCDGWRTADLVSRLQLVQAEVEKVQLAQRPGL